MPCSSGKFMSTVSALQHTAESKLSGVTFPVSGSRYYFSFYPLAVDSCYRVPDFSRYNRLMMIPDIILFFFSSVIKPSFRYGIKRKSFPLKNISFILLICENSHHTAAVPPNYTSFIFNFHFCQSLSIPWLRSHSIRCIEPPIPNVGATHMRRWIRCWEPPLKAIQWSQRMNP